MKLPKLFKNSAIYSIVTVLQKGIAFFLLPLYTAFLTPEDYGTITVVLSVSSLLSVLILMSLQGAGTRFHYKTEDEGKRKVLWGTITTMVLISSVGWTAVFFILHKYLINPFVGKIDFYPYLVLGLINTGISPLYVLFQSYLQASQKAVHYSKNTLSNFLVHLTLAVLLIAVFKLGALGMLLANVITSLLFFIYVIIMFIPKLKMGVNKDVSKVSLKYSLPLVPHQLSIWGSGTIDRLLLNGLKGKDETGLYSVAQQFGSVIGAIAFSVNQAFVPWFYEQLRYGKDGIKKIVKVGDAAVFMYAMIALIVSLFAPEILSVMVSEKFTLVWQIMPFVTFAFVFHGVYFIFINVLFIKDTQMVFVVTISALVVNILANILLIPLWGMMGSAIACFITYLVRSLLAMFISRAKNKEIRYHYVRIYSVVLILMAISMINWVLPSNAPMLSFLLKLTLMAVLSLVFYLQNKNTILLVIQKYRKHA